MRYASLPGRHWGVDPHASRDSEVLEIQMANTSVRKDFSFAAGTLPVCQRWFREAADILYLENTISVDIATRPGIYASHIDFGGSIQP